MRILTDGASVAASASGARPVLLLDLELGGSAGTLRYADRDISTPYTAAGRLLRPGEIRSKLADLGSERTPLALSLLDPDFFLKNLVEQNAFVGKTATLFQHFDELGESDRIPILSGILQEGATWSEADRTLTLRLGDYDVLFRDVQFGRKASAEDLPRIAKDEEGRILPRVYGAPHRVRMVLARGGITTELVRAVSATDTELLVRDASRFPSGPIALRLAYEEIEGEFEGNRFHVTKRGRSIHGGHLSHMSGSPALLRDADLPATCDDAYAGHYLKMTVANRAQTRRIVHSVAATGTLQVAYPFLGAACASAIPAAGAAYEITTLAAPHFAGEAVREALDAFVYIASDAPILGVDAVEGWGVVEAKVKAGKETLVAERRGYLPLPRGSWSVETSDTSFPGLGTIATVRLPRLPTDMPNGRFLENTLWVTARGRPDSQNQLIEHPADILKHWLLDVAGVPADAVDEDSFAAARDARPDLRAAFSLDAVRPLADLLQELAFQARCALLWEGGKAKLRALDNKLPASARTFDDATLAAGGLALSEEKTDELVTELTARFTHKGERAAVTVRDVEAEAEHGRRGEERQFWAFANRAQVVEAATWWLRRKRNPYRTLSFETFLSALPLERLDAATVSRAGIFDTPATGLVTEIAHAPGSLAAGEIDRVRVTLRLPSWGSCQSACEHACETSACEAAGCELSCTSGCESACECGCESSCEAGCQASCTSSCQGACQTTCQLGCRAGGESHDSACESVCEVGCEVTCESVACETSCESCCEASCESADTETLVPVRTVRVVAPPTEPGGALTVVQSDREARDYCPTFTAYDPLDVHPAAGEKAIAILNFQGEWVLAPNVREAKYVRVESDAGGGVFSVIEQDAGGATWGDPFDAHAAG